jgi:hypothetical protein
VGPTTTSTIQTTVTVFRDAPFPGQRPAATTQQPAVPTQAVLALTG